MNKIIHGLEEILAQLKAEAEREAKKDGLIEWGGGESPVSRGAKVRVRFRDGDEGEGTNLWSWAHDGGGGDIIAYRVIEEPKAPTYSGRARTVEEAEFTLYTNGDILGTRAAPREWVSVCVKNGNAFTDYASAELERDRRQVIQELWECDGAREFVPKCWDVYFDGEEWDSTQCLTWQENFSLPHFSTKERAEAAITKLGDRLNVLLPKT